MKTVYFDPAVSGSMRSMSDPHLVYPPPKRGIDVMMPNAGAVDGWYVTLSFTVRVAAYMGILGCILVAFCIVLKCLQSRDIESENTSSSSDLFREQVWETTPILIGRHKSLGTTHGTLEQEEEEDVEEGGSLSGSSDDLYDASLCSICYDRQRSCFFVPCGHCATCYDCAQRIFGGETKACPICRRMIRKVRKLHKS